MAWRARVCVCVVCVCEASGGPLFETCGAHAARVLELDAAHREAERGEAHGHAMVVVGVDGRAAELRDGRARHLQRGAGVQGCRGAGVQGCT